eukprot:GEMP01037386.1.p1 GENE.GEMP01037386.1~~GEMP01037386.1.p1  ORF type:complete len:287 (-),score=56.03 GEMP01037386.1:799-1659(-)
MLKKLKHQVVLKRHIAGEQFNLEDLEDCDIFMLDYSSAVFMDRCTNCRVFCGPVESSFFARNCSGCSLVVACQQFRARDCSDITLSLFCQTEPVIETSSEIRIGCFDFSYFSLAKHFSNAGLNVCCNKWWQVHDFNPREGVPNWLVSLVSSNALLHVDKSGISKDELELPCVVPYTSGGKDFGALVFFLPGTTAALNLFLQHARDSGWTFTRMRSYVLKGSEANALVGKNIYNGETVGVEIANAPGIYEDVEVYVAELQNSNIHVVSKGQLVATSRSFFENLKDEV